MELRVKGDPGGCSSQEQMQRGESLNEEERQVGKGSPLRIHQSMGQPMCGELPKARNEPPTGLDEVVDSKAKHNFCFH